jgi:hypothetical protein
MSELLMLLSPSERLYFFSFPVLTRQTQKTILGK